MANLDFRMHQNVVIRFEAASVGYRILAFIIDAIIVSICLSMGFYFLEGIEALSYLVVAIFVFMYHLIFEMFNKGQSPGKKIFKLRVVTLEGDLPSANQVAIRWIFRLVDIGMSVGLLAIASIMSSAKSQRLGDLMAGTTVIKRPDSYMDKLKEIESLQGKVQEIKYKDMKKYTDKEMILLKKVLDRYTVHPTEENKEKLTMLANKIALDMNVKYEPYAIDKFVRQALQDYVLLTR